jgi:hypothetical protein
VNINPPLYWTPHVFDRMILVAMAASAAERYAIGRPLVCAVCEEESGKRNASSPGGVEDWDPNAIRFEPAFEARYIKPAIPERPTTEELTGAMSFGLMQIMGETAREMGYQGRFLTGLCDPDTGLEFGCRKLKRCLINTNGDPTSALLRWNGGSDGAYPSRVMARMSKYS